jgi:hypothetical protein
VIQFTKNVRRLNRIHLWATGLISPALTPGLLVAIENDESWHWFFLITNLISLGIVRVKYFRINFTLVYVILYVIEN